MQHRDPHRAPARRDAATLLLITLSVLMALILGVITYVVMAGRPPDEAPSNPDAPAGADGAAGLDCDAMVLERSLCPEGFFCNFNVCEPVPRPTACKRDVGCRDGCVCPEGKLCHNNACLAPEEIVRKPKICEEDARLAEAVKTLAQECASRKRDIGDLASSGACSTQDWEQLAMEDERFNLLIEAFPNRFAVHFPTGEPKPPDRGKRGAGAPWPGPSTREHYLAQVRNFRDVLLASRQIFVIGRPSPDEGAKTNHVISVQRLSFVINLIESVLSEGVPETERAKVRRPVWSFVLPKASPIDPARYRQTYVAPQGERRPGGADSMVVWDAENSESMRSALDDAALLEARSGRRWQELFGALNRVVLVIPIPCLGDEYQPPKTVLPSRAPEGDSP